MAVEGIDILKGDDETAHEHVWSVWMNYRDKPKPATEYRVCQVQIPNKGRCPRFETREKIV